MNVIENNTPQKFRSSVMTWLISTLFSAVLCSYVFARAGVTFEKTAASCSAADIQAAADIVKAAGGGTVYIPEGTCDHNSGTIKIPDGINLIGAGQDKTIISNVDIRVSTRFYGNLDKPFRISGMSFLGDSHIDLDTVHDFRIDHIAIETASATAIGVDASHSGVIDHCTVIVNGSYYGVTINGGNNAVWEDDISKVLGQPTAVFIEDCVFTISAYSHATVGHGAAHYVVRHSTFNGPGFSSYIDAHGPGYGPPHGTRAVEIYDNLFNIREGRAIGLRGGGGVLFNNDIPASRENITLVLESGSSGLYPVPDQVHDLWIWDNIYSGKPIVVTSWGGTGNLNPKNYIKENRDYFLRAPSQELDGFTYTPYTYPHPLVTDSPTSVEDSGNPLPKAFSLEQNYPNPFSAIGGSALGGNPVTTIQYFLAQPSSVQIIVYNQLGQQTRVLVNEERLAGEYDIIWDGKNDQGEQVTSGVYIYLMRAGDQVLQKKMVLL